MHDENSMIMISTHSAQENSCDIISNQFIDDDTKMDRKVKYLEITEKSVSFVLQAPRKSNVKQGLQTSILRNIVDIFQLENDYGKVNVII